MAIVEVKVGRGMLTNAGRALIAASMYEKGKNFIGAAILLRKSGGYEFVVLHLLCQGIEAIIKGLLLLKNHKEYEPKLKSVFGHNLVKLSDAAIHEFGVKPLKSHTATELASLNDYYSRHALRYGTHMDIFLHPDSLSSKLVLRKIAAVIRLSNRYVGKSVAI